VPRTKLRADMIYRMINTFLEVWFQNLDAWLKFYERMPDLEHKVALIQATREMMNGFLESIEILETEALFLLDSETKDSS
jgi:hypothetical protein